LDDSLQVEDVGFTDRKLGNLDRLYVHEEGRAIAVDLWARVRDKAKIGSVTFHTCNHLIKGAATVEEAENRGGRRSVQGPCMTGVTLTWLNKSSAAIDIPYRSVELYRKFVADLVFMRDTLLAPFDLSGMHVEVTCHFFNITLHPMYWVFVLYHHTAPFDAFDAIRDKDPGYYRHLLKNTSEYLLPERGTSIANHSASLRVKEWALKAFDATTLRRLQEYLRANL
jgi:hypothetical protein